MARGKASASTCGSMFVNDCIALPDRGMGKRSGLIRCGCIGTGDLAAAARTVTVARRSVMVFGQPFFETGLGVVVPNSGIAAW
jgi:hypothetical protein